MIRHRKVGDRLHRLSPFIELWMDRLQLGMVLLPGFEQHGGDSLGDKAVAVNDWETVLPHSAS
jgi:hypothetical protein